MEDNEYDSKGDYDEYQPSSYRSGEEDISDSAPGSPLPAVGALQGDAQAPNPRVYNGLILSETEFERRETERHRRILAVINSPRNPDDTLPRNDQDKCRLVEKLVSAFNNTKNIIDKDLKHGKPSQAAQRILIGGHPAIDIEMMLWRVVKGMIECQFGERMTAQHHRRRFEEYSTFGDRFDKVYEAILTSKAICKQMMDASYLGRVVDAPAEELRCKKNNRELNGVRNTQNEIGRQFTRRGITVDGAKELFGSSESDVKPESSPVKRSGRKASSKTTTGDRGRITKRTPAWKPSARKPRSGTASGRKPRSGTASGRKIKAKKEESPEHSIDPKLQEYPMADNYQCLYGFSSSPPPYNGNDAVNYSEGTNHGDVGGSDFSPNSNPEPAGVADELTYRLALCEMLGIPRDLAHSYSLRDLRIYARAINTTWRDEPWQVREMGPGRVGVKFYIWCPGDNQMLLIDILPHFEQLALARGDFVDGVYNPNLTDLNSHQTIYRAMVLGHYPNPFDVIDFSIA